MPPPARRCCRSQNLEAWYGESHILHGVDFDVTPGEVVTLLGRNGAGKTTTLKSIMGIIGKRTGSVRFEGAKSSRTLSDRIARLGDRALPGGARHIRQPRRRGKPDAAAAGAQPAACRSSRSSSCSRT